MRFLLSLRKLCSVFNKMSSDDLPAPPAPPAPVGTCTATDGSVSQTTESACTGVWTAPTGGGRHRGVKAKTLRRMLKKAGLKTSGKKSTLTKRCKKAHLMRGGLLPSSPGAGGPAAWPFDAGMVQRGGHYGNVSSFGSNEEFGKPSTGGRRRGVKAKTLKKLLKKAGLKVSGKKSTLRARAKKAYLVRGGLVASSGSAEEAGPGGAAWKGWGDA